MRVSPRHNCWRFDAHPPKNTGFWKFPERQRNVKHGETRRTKATRNKTEQKTNKRNKPQYNKQSCDSGTIEKSRPPAGSNTNASGSREMKADPVGQLWKMWEVGSAANASDPDLYRQSGCGAAALAETWRPLRRRQMPPSLLTYRKPGSQDADTLSLRSQGRGECAVSGYRWYTEG